MREAVGAFSIKFLHSKAFIPVGDGFSVPRSLSLHPWAIPVSLHPRGSGAKRNGGEVLNESLNGFQT